MSAFQLTLAALFSLQKIGLILKNELFLLLLLLRAHSAPSLHSPSLSVIGARRPTHSQRREVGPFLEIKNHNSQVRISSFTPWKCSNE